MPPMGWRPHGGRTAAARRLRVAGGGLARLRQDGDRLVARERRPARPRRAEAFDGADLGLGGAGLVQLACGTGWGGAGCNLGLGGASSSSGCACAVTRGGHSHVCVRMPLRGLLAPPLSPKRVERAAVSLPLSLCVYVFAVGVSPMATRLLCTVLRSRAAAVLSFTCGGDAAAISLGMAVTGHPLAQLDHLDLSEGGQDAGAGRAFPIPLHPIPLHPIPSRSPPPS